MFNLAWKVGREGGREEVLVMGGVE